MSITPLRESNALEIRLFGGWEVRHRGTPIPRTRTQSGQWLLALLAMRQGREVERDWLAGTLWPDSGERQALYNLRRCLSELRHALGAEACRLLSPTPRRVALDISCTFVDVAEFDRAAARTDAASLERAVGLYRGPLLEGCFEEWVPPERARYERAYLAALDTLASQATAQGNRAAAAEYLRRALGYDPLRETALRGLMQSLAESGDTVGAMAVYRQFRIRLHDDLQAEPDAETVAVYQSLRAANGKKRPAANVVAPETVAALHHVPHPVTPLIGRDAEIARIAKRLEETRLVTLTGTGGVGKTRLAIAVAHQVAGRFADGVWFLDLAALTDSSQLTHSVTALLKAPEEREGGAIETLCRFLAEKSPLLILDNCEHLLQECAELTETLLHRCPKIRLLATSRQTLGIGGERVARVPGLSVPESDAIAPYPGLTEEEARGRFLQSDAALLFLQGAASANAAFPLTPENRRHVLQICRKLDGIPFAIELASAWAKSLPVAEIAARLDDRFALLVGGSRTARPRQRTLRAALDWSYELLTDAEKTLLCRLSVFSGGWTLEAAERIGSGQWTAGADVVLLLRQLVDKSLVVYEEREGRARYRLLETTRHYARERLSADDSAETRRRHACFFLQWARQASEAQEGWQSRLRDEWDNLRAALTWWRGEDLASGAALLLTLWHGGALSYHSQEARAWVDCLQKETELPAAPQYAELYREVGAWADWLGFAAAAALLWEKSLATATLCGDIRGEASALLPLGCYAMARADYERAATQLQTCQAHFEALEERGRAAEARNRLALLTFCRGDATEAQRLLEISLADGRERDDESLITDALDILGFVAYKRRDYAAAREYFAELAERLGAAGGYFTANALRHLGAAEAALGDFPSAERHHEEARAINRRIGFLPGEGWDCYSLANVALRRGDEANAWANLDESLKIFEDIGEIGSITVCLGRWAQFEARAGAWERAARLLAHTEHLVGLYRGSTELQLFADSDDPRGSSLADCRSHLSEIKFAEAQTQGRLLPTERVIAYARSARHPKN